MTPRTALVWALAACVAVTGCALPQKKWGMGATGGALAGAAVGAGAGAGVGAGIGDDSASDLGRDAAIGAAIGLIVGGLVGHYVFDEELKAPPPVAEVAPAPEPAAIEALGNVIAVVDVSRFGFDEAEIPPSAHPDLNALAAKLNERPDLHVVLEGHTDDVGSAEYNYELGLRRAEAVLDYLASHGVAHERMTARSKGMQVPVASNATPEGREKNRRVEVRAQDAAAAVVTPEEGEAPEEQGGAEPVLLAPAPEVRADASGHAETVVYFSPANAIDLDPHAVQGLDNVVNYLANNPRATVVVTGYCDGVVEINRATATIRAERVKTYLVSRGVGAERVTLESMVAAPSGAAPDDEAVLAANRRAVLAVTAGE